MSGHNKWSKIKRQKGAEDAKKSKIFGMLGRLISAESKKAKGDTNSAGLRAAIDKARKENMPNDNIERAVKRGAGGDGAEMTEFLLEGYGPGGIAVIAEGLTDNKNRTISEIKHLFAKYGAALASPGAAIWAFAKSEEGWKATSTLEVPDDDAQSLQNLIDDLEEHEDVKTVTTNANSGD